MDLNLLPSSSLPSESTIKPLAWRLKTGSAMSGVKKEKVLSPLPDIFTFAEIKKYP